ncbi:DUF4192 domain-containing protein [Saccharothrix saharensis]|uniref:DUF4192 domain-containing protein n=1 Tax=Saccharothrix saharensis TaxID=571190 RepID=UPI0036C19F13
MSDSTPDPTTPADTLDQSTPARLSEPGELIAASPHMIGYYPADALLINIIVNDLIELTMCSPLPDDDLSDRLVDQITMVAARYPGAAVIGVVIGGGEPEGHVPPHTALVTRLRRAITEHATSLHMFWTTAITAGARWQDYDDQYHTGVLPDPKTSLLAAKAAVQGLRVFDSRDDRLAVVRPDPQDALARRANMIDRLPDQARRRSARDSYRMVMNQVGRTGQRPEALSDQEIAVLAVALSDPLVRDACIATATGEHAQAAEQLWTELTRACPTPQCAEPAVLLAVSAYLRGDGGLAALALDRAETAVPGHRLAALLGAALDKQIPPDRLRRIVDHASETAKQLVMANVV